MRKYKTLDSFLECNSVHLEVQAPKWILTVISCCAKKNPVNSLATDFLGEPLVDWFVAYLELKLTGRV